MSSEVTDLQAKGQKVFSELLGSDDGHQGESIGEILGNLWGVYTPLWGVCSPFL